MKVKEITDELNVNNIEDLDCVKKYLSKIFTVLSKETREKLMNLNLSEERKLKLARELAFLPEAKQKDYLKELIRVYRQMLKGY